MRRRVWIYLGIAAAAYAAFVVMLWVAQDGMVFPGAGYGPRPVGVAGVRTFTLQGRDGPFRVVESVPDRPAAVLVFFVGNGEDLVSAGYRAAGFARHGLAVVCPEYPGYGGSAGRPGVEALHAAALATAEYAAGLAKERGVPLVAGGISLGSFCAVHLAARGLVERLFLAAPPTSILDVANSHFWWVPVALFLRHRFDNVAPAANVRCPVLVVHGENDRVVPFALGERLFALFAGEKELIRVPGAGHNDLPLAAGDAVGERVGAFLRGR